MNIVAALILGFLGSFHCVGMCGPIALALPLNRSTNYTRVMGALSYNSGRVLTYTLLGSAFGLLGKGFVIAGYQQALSVFAGVFILLLFFSSGIKEKLNIRSASLFGLVAKLKYKLRQQFKKSGNSSLFITGSLNGLLPCGLVYLGIAGAIATGDALKGSFFMFLFGLGTVPAMLILSFIGNSINLNLRNKIRRVIPVFVIVTAVLLILRGMNLGIPYVSPQMSVTKAECHKCCKE
jgi:uncharacterized protein